MDGTNIKDDDICKMCKELLPIHGGHIVILDDIRMKICEFCFKSIVNLCIDKMHRGLYD